MGKSLEQVITVQIRLQTPKVSPNRVQKAVAEKLRKDRSGAVFVRPGVEPVAG